jgi:hypothetical protein
VQDAGFFVSEATFYYMDGLESLPTEMARAVCKEREVPTPNTAEEYGEGQFKDVRMPNGQALEADIQSEPIDDHNLDLSAAVPSHDFNFAASSEREPEIAISATDAPLYDPATTFETKEHSSEFDVYGCQEPGVESKPKAFDAPADTPSKPPAASTWSDDTKPPATSTSSFFVNLPSSGIFSSPNDPTGFKAAASTSSQCSAPYVPLVMPPLSTQVSSAAPTSVHSPQGRSTYQRSPDRPVKPLPSLSNFIGHDKGDSESDSGHGKEDTSSAFTSTAHAISAFGQRKTIRKPKSCIDKLKAQNINLAQPGLLAPSSPLPQSQMPRQGVLPAGAESSEADVETLNGHAKRMSRGQGAAGGGGGGDAGSVDGKQRRGAVVMDAELARELAEWDSDLSDVNGGVLGR